MLELGAIKALSIFSGVKSSMIVVVNTALGVSSAFVRNI